jgi:2',3'-cyclic-nucleotide 2'-phosphodiesterase (5'-nucleotidase family)
MNAVGYELAVLGNNEFKAKDAAEREDATGAQSALLKVVKRARFPWLAANVTDTTGATLEGVQPFVVRQWKGVRVGFLGLTAPVSGTYPQTRGWKFADPIETAKAWIPRARAQCDVLVAVTHLGTVADQQLAAQTSGIDAIVGGHSHTFLYQPLEVKNAKDVPVPIVQDGEFGVNLGRFDLRFRRNTGGDWSLASYKSELLPVGPELAEASDVAAAVAPYVRPFEKVVGRIERIAATPEERERQTSQIVTDALRRASGADLALHPLGANLFNSFRRAEVTRFDVFAALPFKDRICVVELTGDEIGKLRADVPSTLVSSGAPALQAGTTYRVAMINFVGRTAYKLPDAKLRDTGIDVREAVIQALAQ